MLNQFTLDGRYRWLPVMAEWEARRDDVIDLFKALGGLGGLGGLSAHLDAPKEAGQVGRHAF